MNQAILYNTDAACRSKSERYFNGYREENSEFFPILMHSRTNYNLMAVIGFFINLVSSLAYFARVVANPLCSRGFIMLTELRYCDYMTTCPFLVMDLLWNLEAPYKWSSPRTSPVLPALNTFPFQF